jgi:hypothetical protein
MAQGERTGVCVVSTFQLGSPHSQAQTENWEYRWFFYFILFCLFIIKFELRALYLLGRHFTASVTLPSSWFFITGVFLGQGSASREISRRNS